LASAGKARQSSWVTGGQARRRCGVASGRQISAASSERALRKLASHRLLLATWHLGGPVPLRPCVAFGREPARHRAWHLGGIRQDGAVRGRGCGIWAGLTPFLNPDSPSTAGKWRSESQQGAPRLPIRGPARRPQAHRFDSWHLGGIPWHLGGGLRSALIAESTASRTYPVAFRRSLQLAIQLLLPISFPPKCHIDHRTRLRQGSASQTVTVAGRAGR
jgi:hypothetical protein